VGWFFFIIPYDGGKVNMRGEKRGSRAGLLDRWGIGWYNEG
jgi:hypothetical protein